MPSGNKHKTNALNVFSPLGTPDALSVNKTQDRVDLYADRKKIYPRRVYGLFRRLKWLVMTFTLTLYYGLPWLRWDRGEGFPDQAVLIDMPARKAYFFGIEIWSQEVYYVTGLLILAAFILFLTTSLAGRVWCGYACPQTVWTDLFVHIERWIQGDRSARIRLDKARWSAVKIFKIASTHAAWLLVSLLTGGAMVLYFHDAPSTAVGFFLGEASLSAYIFAFGLAFFTYLLGGTAREQVCIYMCPWPRIQGALVDEHSFLVTYDISRGEPRGKFRKKDTFDNRGDCIDCNQCVAVCPMGIDIRDGFQMECIQCALCVDACDTIMEKVDRPKGLIRYMPTHQSDSGGLARKETKIMRPRIYVYLGLIMVVGLLMLSSLFARTDFTSHVSKDRNPLFVTMSDGSFRNGYDMHLINRQHRERTVYIRAEGVKGLTLSGPYGGLSERVKATVPADGSSDIRLFVFAPKEAVKQGDIRAGKGAVIFRVEEEDGGLIVAGKAPLHAPVR